MCIVIIKKKPVLFLKHGKYKMVPTQAITAFQSQSQLLQVMCTWGKDSAFISGRIWEQVLFFLAKLKLHLCKVNSEINFTNLACPTFYQQSSRGPSLSRGTLPPLTNWLTSFSTRTASAPVLHADWFDAMIYCVLIGQSDKTTKPMRPKRVREVVEKILSTLSTQLSCEGACRPNRLCLLHFNMA